MPYALQYTTASGKYVSYPALAIASGENFSIECVASIDATGIVRLIGNPSGTFTSRAWLQQNATPNVRLTNAAGASADWNFSFVIGTYYKIRFVRTGSTLELFIDNVSQGTKTLSGSFSFEWFFAQSTTFGAACTVRYFEFISNAGTRLYRNDSGTGSIWPDVNNPANNATQQGTWPANDSEWVFYSSGADRNKNYCNYSGAGGFTSPTLGDLITGSPKLKVIIKKLSLTGTDTRAVFWQGGSSPANQQFLFRRNGNGNYEVFLGGTATYIFTFSEALAIFGSQTSLTCDEFAIEIDGTTARVYKDGSLAITKTGVARGANLFSGALFRVGCQAIDDSPTNTASGTFAPANSTFGDIQVYINDVLVRDYITPSTGTTIPDAVGNNTLTEQGTWPSDDGEWIPIGDGGSTSWTGTIGKTSLSLVTKALSINTGQVLVPNKVTFTLSTKQQSISTGFVATNGKTSLTLSPKQESINVGYINTLSKLGLALLQKQLSITVGANLPFTGVIGKTTYALNGKQLGLAIGWNSGVVKSTLPVSNKQESVLAGFVNTINEINIPVNGKPLNLQTGTSISYVGTINKGSLNASGKPLNVVAGTSIPFVGLIQKTSLTLTGKQLGVVRGQVLDLQKQALNIIGKQLSLGEIVYPIVPIERIFTIKDGDRIHYFKQTTTVYVMKNN